MSDYALKVKKLENSQVEMEGELSVSLVEKFEDKALGRLGADIELPGFRKGKVPRKMVKEKVGDVRVWVEAGELALEAEYSKIIESSEVDVIGAPQVQITKLAPGNPLGFKITVGVMPVVKLPNYKKIAKGVVKELKDESFEVTDKEIEDLMRQLQQARARHEQAIDQKNNEAKNPESKDSKDSQGEFRASEDSGVESTIVGADGKPLTQESKETTKQESKGADSPSPKASDEQELPEFNDEFAKSLGDFKNVEDFKKKAKDNMVEEKKMRAKEKVRVDIVEAIIKDMKVDLPEVLVDGELARMMAQLEGDISRGGYSVADYLKHAKKTEEDLRKEWRPQAEKRAKTQLLLLEIAKQEKLTPDETKVQENVTRMLSQYKGVDEARVRAYVEEALKNERVMEYLESL